MTDQSLIVMAAVSPRDDYYGKFFEDIAKFQIQYAKLIESSGDRAIIVCPEDALETYASELPKKCLRRYTIEDIWMRDFCPASFRAQKPLTFRPNYVRAKEAARIQKSFDMFISKFASTDLCATRSSLILDGGNVVDNLADKAVVTTRVFADNPSMSHVQVLAELRSSLNCTEIAVIPDFGDRTGHSDGIVAFLDEHVIAVSLDDVLEMITKLQPRKSIGSADKNAVVHAILNAFGHDEKLKIVHLASKCKFSTWRGFDSACGLHVNICATKRNLYVPTFGHDAKNCGSKLQSVELDEKVLQQIRENTTKTVVPVPVDHTISRMGGSVRCLSWSLDGELAEKLLSSPCPT